MPFEVIFESKTKDKENITSPESPIVGNFYNNWYGRDE